MSVTVDCRDVDAEPAAEDAADFVVCDRVADELYSGAVGWLLATCAIRFVVLPAYLSLAEIIRQTVIVYSFNIRH